MTRAVVVIALLLAGGAAAIALSLAFSRGGGNSGSATALQPTLEAISLSPSPTPFPLTWADGLDHATGAAILISCFDSNGDGRIDGDDGESLSGIDITLVPDLACVHPARHRDFYAGMQLRAAAESCNGARPPLLIVGIASAGSDLLDTTGGESLGLLPIVNQLQERAAEARIGTELVIAVAAVFGAENPQTEMELWLEHYIRQRLETLPCMRVALIGHSHGGVAVTSVTAALDDGYSSRMFGVAIDRTTALYDRPAAEYPSSTTILNVYQTNEGWHGGSVDLPNVINEDESTERAPVALSDGGGGLALVSHKTLDDSPGVQRRIEDAVMGWLLQQH